VIALQDPAFQDPAAGPSVPLLSVPLLRGREAAPDGAPQVFLCRGMLCELPVGSVAKLRERLAAMTF
jgi:hypothetical protein